MGRHVSVNRTFFAKPYVDKSPGRKRIKKFVRDLRLFRHAEYIAEFSTSSFSLTGIFAFALDMHINSSSPEFAGTSS